MTWKGLLRKFSYYLAFYGPYCFNGVPLWFATVKLRLFAYTSTCTIVHTVNWSHLCMLIFFRPHYISNFHFEMAYTLCMVTDQYCILRFFKPTSIRNVLGPIEYLGPLALMCHIARIAFFLVLYLGLYLASHSFSYSWMTILLS